MVGRGSPPVGAVLIGALTAVTALAALGTGAAAHPDPMSTGTELVAVWCTPLLCVIRHRGEGMRSGL